MIHIEVSTDTVMTCGHDAAVIALANEQVLSTSAQQVDEASQQCLSRYLATGDQKGDFGDWGILYDVAGMQASRLVLVGSGSDDLSLMKLQRLAAKVARQLQKTGVEKASLYFTDLSVGGASLAEKVHAVAQGVWLGLYAFTHHQTKAKKASVLSHISIAVNADADLEQAQAALQKAKAVASGMILARNLGNEPGNVCTPTYLGDQAEALSHPKLDVQVWDKAAIEHQGLRGLLAVNQGSSEEPRFIVLNYQGGKPEQKSIALVGKGLTFDSGGISIKPSPAMDEMKFDMCGSAAVLGVFKAITEMNLPVNVKGFISSTENMPSASAYKPGDVLESYKGVTIEVLNTDAEGRIILADALTYACEQDPACVIDYATLTGACVIALGAQASGLLGNNQDLIDQVHAASMTSGDRAWPMPMFEEYQEQIESKIADIKNTGGRAAGTVTAACFLSRFVDERPWVHLDIAGTAWNMEGSDLCVSGATGAGVALTVDFLEKNAV
ncbi:MAG: leucyl aminopeptidase [Mariprofundaceae bacterium]|nr:leucyl aminopeptidase [Mariprofundaceae bacterium]